MSLEEKHMERLYDLLRRIADSEPDTAATLRWAIFQLERNAVGGLE